MGNLYEEIQEFPDDGRELMMGTGPAMEVAGGFVCLLFAALGLMGSPGMHTPWLAAAATFVTGAAIILESEATSKRFMVGISSDRRSGAGDQLEAALVAEFLGGAIVIILGTIALIRIFPTGLISTALIVSGISLIVGSYALFHVPLAVSRGYDNRLDLPLAAGLQSIAGIVTIASGAVALTAANPVTPFFFGVMAAGFAVLAVGGALSTRAREKQRA